jgi:hypothetical protein
MDYDYVPPQYHSPPQAIIVAYEKYPPQYGVRPVYVIKRELLYPQQQEISLPPAQPIGLPPPYLPPDPVPVIQEPKKEIKMVDNTKDRFFHDCMKWYQSVRECTRIWNSDPDASVSD